MNSLLCSPPVPKKLTESDLNTNSQFLHADSVSTRSRESGSERIAESPGR